MSRLLDVIRLGLQCKRNWDDNYQIIELSTRILPTGEAELHYVVEHTWGVNNKEYENETLILTPNAAKQLGIS